MKPRPFVILGTFLNFAQLILESLSESSHVIIKRTVEFFLFSHYFFIRQLIGESSLLKPDPEVLQRRLFFVPHLCGSPALDLWPRCLILLL